MSWRHTALSLLILLCFLTTRMYLLLSPPPPIEPSWFIPPPHDDPEGRLAMGFKLPLSCADVWSLELLKGVSDTLAFELVAKRYEIMRAALNESPAAALGKARGIGDTTAAKLLKYLDLTERCEISEEFEVWNDRP
jgi:hypothetical protein